MYDQCTKDLMKGQYSTMTGDHNLPAPRAGNLPADGNWMNCMNKYLSMFDGETGLPGRMKYDDKVDTAVTRHKGYQHDAGNDRFELQQKMQGVLDDKGPEAFLRARETEAKGSAWPHRHHALFMV